MKKEDDEIKVVDRRRFDDEGTEREDAPERSRDEAPADVTPDAGAEQQGGEMPPIDFITFILSLSQTAFLNLGLGPHPETGKASPVDLVSARWTIDALEMLHDKTRGNLSGEEERIFERILAELRMAYVQIASQHGGKPS
jgi:hypothetical protein